MRLSLVLVLGFAAGACSTTPPQTLPLHSRTGSKGWGIGTYNVFVGTRDLGKTADIIRGMPVDVVALQEIAASSEAILDRKLSREFQYRHFEGGLGLVSHFPMRHLRYRSSKHGINGFLFAEIEAPGGLVQIANLHLDPLRAWTLGDKLLLPLQIGRQAAIQRDELAQVMENLQPGLPTILLGDFNRVGDTAIRRLRSLAFTDSFASVTPQADRTPTLHFSILGLQLGKRIDFIFHDDTFQTTRSWIISGKPSDHDAVLSHLSRIGPATGSAK